MGSPLLNLGNRPLINYGVAQVAGYSFNYSDPNDPSDTSVRHPLGGNHSGQWNDGQRQAFHRWRPPSGGNFAFLPITLDAAVDK